MDSDPGPRGHLSVYGMGTVASCATEPSPTPMFALVKKHLSKEYMSWHNAAGISVAEHRPMCLSEPMKMLLQHQVSLQGNNMKIIQQQQSL